MYRVNFPSRLTEEEKLLKKKYKLLREKKEQLEKLNAEKDDIIFEKKKKALSVLDDSSDDESEMENKPKDPKELAKKLVQSGAIVLRKNEPPRVFKKTQALERKLSVTPRPPPPLKMKIKRVHDGSAKDSEYLGDGDGEGMSEMKSGSSRYVCHLPKPTQSSSSLPGSRPFAMGTGMRMEAKSSSHPQPSSSSSANQPSSSFRMRAGPSSSSTAAPAWHELVEANRQRMNQTRGDYVDYKRRGLVSYRDVNESSDDDN